MSNSGGMDVNIYVCKILTKIFFKNLIVFYTMIIVKQEHR